MFVPAQHLVCLCSTCSYKYKGIQIADAAIVFCDIIQSDHIFTQCLIFRVVLGKINSVNVSITKMNFHSNFQQTIKMATQPSASPTYKLTYFNIQGLAEPIRMLLSYGGIKFEDVRIEKDKDWPALKPSKLFARHVDKTFVQFRFVLVDSHSRNADGAIASFGN